MESKHLLETELYTCDHISEKDWDSLQSFTVKTRDGLGYGLQFYIRERALKDERSGFSRTYIVRTKTNPSEIVAYFTLQCGLVSTNEHKRLFTRTFDSIPGIELSNFAVNGAYIQSHPKDRGVGMLVFQRFVLPVIEIASMYVGMEMLYIYALPAKNLIDRYRQYGFERLDRKDERCLHRRIKPNYDQGCIFMYMLLSKN